MFNIGNHNHRYFDFGDLRARAPGRALYALDQGQFFATQSRSASGCIRSNRSQPCHCNVYQTDPYTRPGVGVYRRSLGDIFRTGANICGQCIRLGEGCLQWLERSGQSGGRPCRRYVLWLDDIAFGCAPHVHCDCLDCRRISSVNARPAQILDKPCPFYCGNFHV